MATTPPRTCPADQRTLAGRAVSRPRGGAAVLGLIALTLALPGVARAVDLHTKPVVRDVVRNKAGNVQSCVVRCTLVGAAASTARFTLHRRGAYDGELKSMNDAIRRLVAAGTITTPKGKGARWVSADILKRGTTTTVELALDFGPLGLKGSEDHSSEWLLSSAHFKTPPRLGTPPPHVFAAETAPAQRPDDDQYFRFPPGGAR